MTLLVHRGCEEEGEHHDGVHWHDDDGEVYYRAAPDIVMSMAERERHRSQMDMEAMFGEIMI